MEVQTVEDEGELRRKRPCDSRPMPIILLVLRSCNVTKLSEKVIKQLWSRVNLLMKIRLKGESGTYRTKVRGKEERGHLESIPLAMVGDPLAKVTVGRGEVRVREEKMSLLPER